MRKKTNEIKFLSKKQLSKLLKTIENTKETNKYYLRDLTIFHLSYYCWLRISEISLIKRENYNKQTKEIYIRRLKGSLNSTIKLDKKREQILNKYLREYKKNEDSDLFTTKTWKQMTKSTLEFLTHKYKNLSNIKDFHFHMLKHSIAVHLLEIWLSIFELKNYLWHKSINSTLVYSTFTPQMSNEMYEKINKWGFLV